jgi:hypothetical protein
MRLLLLSLVVLSSLVDVSAQRPAGEVVVEPQADSREPHRFFGDRTVTVPLSIYATDPEALIIRADLVQLTTALAIAVYGDLEVPVRPTDSAISPIVSSLALRLPAVERETDFELRFRSRRQADADWHSAGRVGLRVYPANLIDPIRVWAESHPLRVEDNRGVLRQFLREQQIAMAAPSRRPEVTLRVGERSPADTTPLSLGPGKVVLFTERETEIPRLIIDRARTTIIKVEMRLVDRLASDPLAHKLLLEIFQHLHEHALPVKGVSQ